MRRMSLRLVTVFAVALLVVSPTMNAQSNASRGAAKGAGEGALIGAIAGAIFGDGDVLGNAAEGAFIGGSVGAISGALAGGSVDRRERAQFEQLIRQFGEDNLRGYVEMMQCNYDKAIALFRVGELASVRDHKLAAIWLQAIAEKDRKNVEKAEEIYKRIIESDPDIDDMEQASLAINQYVLTLREDRRANRLPSCSL